MRATSAAERLTAERADVLLHAVEPARAGDGHHVLPLRQQPGEAELRGRAALLRGDRLDLRNQRAVLREVLLLEARMRGAPPVDLREVGDRAGQEAAAERRIGDEADAERPRDGARRLGLLAVQQRVLGLHRGDRVRRMGAADGLRRGLGQAEVAHLPLLDQPGHRADRLLDRHGGIDAVLVVEVDHLDAEALEGGLAGLLHVVGPAVHAVRPARVLRLAELGGEEDLVADALQRLADHRLVVAPAIHVGAVEMRDAEIDGVADQLDGLRVVRVAIDAGERHAAEADGGDRGAALAEGALCECHVRSPRN